ncbi:hypothetical protein TCAL_11503 [Tigriopus californicus]|uniref:RING-type E3 ubiquitin transferase n=1 Tax=Tigriopus californicus TaxID=6832 RepID=A0A553NFF4_TIGCA|nr:uncharacterized protein LOC131888843 [Tigriopus californicus]TRY64176.1 hypothetical protein TCAL_11503 [Tigriopus californicus]|eukprot:TCALIF_11503-PA protein Name:"Similar to At5g37910 Putative E3 ubiquitin-protein ligase SINA-like 9 (Arabidopsis thaliana)" AED:0.00 eAED:0.00 QI:30/1/1/1/1/1/3/192/276
MDLALLIDELECPICCQTPRGPPIFQCENGHLICSACKPRMAKCPQGGCELDQQRSRIAENLLNNADIPRPCIYSSVGCFHEDLLSDLIEHETKCEFRKVFCPDLECGEVVVAKELLGHFKEDHPDHVKNDIEDKDLDRCVWIIDPDDLRKRSFTVTWPMSIWKKNGLTFFSVLHKYKNSDLWYSWICCDCPPDLAKTMTALVRMRSKSGVPELTYKGRVHPLDISCNDIVRKASSCLVATDDVIHSFLMGIPDEHKSEHEKDDQKFLLAMEYSIL